MAFVSLRVPIEIARDTLDRDFPLSLLDSLFLRYLVADSSLEELDEGDLLHRLDDLIFSFSLRNLPSCSKIMRFWLMKSAL